VIAPALLMCIGLVSSCNTTPNQGSDQTQERRFALKGKIISIDEQQQQIVVDHEAIPGFMGAMAMPYPVSDAQVLDSLAPGDEIRADLVVRNGSPTLEKIVVIKKSGGTPASPGSGGLHPQTGDVVPDFVFLNQDGKRIHLRDFRGQSVLLTFIYTRCPLADFCPAMNIRFSAIEEEIRKSINARKKTHLLSVSFDPQHDTPKVLRDYGLAYLHGSGENDFRHWEFAVAPESDLKNVAAFFGLTFIPDKNKFAHSMSTAIISPGGKIVKWYGEHDLQTSDILKEFLNSIGPEQSF
jgi:protein SCO1